MSNALVLAALAALLGASIALLARGASTGHRTTAFRVAAVAVGLLALTAVVAVTMGLVRLDAERSIPATEPLATEAGDLARGERLAYLCADCHTHDGEPPLEGGSVNFSPPLGTLYAPNLTPAGSLSAWSDGELIAAIRHGVDARGRTLLIMPSDTYAALTEPDLASLVSYLRSQPAVPHDVPPRRLNPLGLAVIGLGLFPTSAEAATTRMRNESDEPTSPGAYVARIAGCGNCHGEDLTGGDPNGFAPAGPGLQGVGRTWSPEAFVQTLRTGTTPDGRALDESRMPWRTISQAFTDRELRQLHTHIRDSTGSSAPASAGAGDAIYAQRCSSCHGSDGRGGTGPALQGNRRLDDASFVIRRILRGGGGMPAWSTILDDEDVAAVASHVRTNWGNDHGAVDAADVSRQRP